jgi:hypothetical protein
MKNSLRVVFVVSLAALLNASALAQRAVPPPPKPADSGPSLEDTMKFVQDRMNNQGSVGYVSNRSNLPGVTFRNYYTISGVVVDPSACTLQTTETTVETLEVPPGSINKENGKPYNVDDYSSRRVEMTTIHLREIESLRVESMQDMGNRSWVEAAHPEVTVTVTPAVYYLTLIASKPVFAFHLTYTIGKQPAKEVDNSAKEDHLSFRDEETADRMAKALTHAVELCGGGDKDLFAPTAQEVSAMERARQQQAQLQAQQAQQQIPQQAQENAQQQAVADCQQQCSADYDACKSAAKSQMKTGVAMGFLGKLLKTTSVADSVTDIASNATDSFSACDDANTTCTAACQ